MVLALDLGSGPWITFLDQMREGKGKVAGEYGLDTEYGLHLTEAN